MKRSLVLALFAAAHSFAAGTAFGQGLQIHRNTASVTPRGPAFLQAVSCKSGFTPFMQLTFGFAAPLRVPVQPVVVRDDGARTTLPVVPAGSTTASATVPLSGKPEPMRAYLLRFLLQTGADFVPPAKFTCR